MATPQHPREQQLGAYRVLERIGRGGMGVVYRAQHLRLGREAAIKVLPVTLADEADYLRRFEREAASVASLDHPNILPVWEYGEQDGAPYLVMPFVRGGSLKERLERGPLPREELLHYLAQMAEALDFAHEQGLVHRDVKPANMLLDGRGRLYLADFGIAKALDGSAGLTATGVGVGTPEYMAPEQAQGRADARSDLYALGVVLYQMLSGRVPYSGTSAIEVLMQHVQAPLPLEPLRGVTPPLPPGIAEVMQRALAKDPGARYGSGRALVEAVAAALSGERPTEPAPRGAMMGGAVRDERTIITRAPPAPQGRRLVLPLAGLAGLLVLLLAAGGAFALLRSDPVVTPTANAGGTATTGIAAGVAATTTATVGATATVSAPTATVAAAVAIVPATATVATTATSAPTATAAPATATVPPTATSVPTPAGPTATPQPQPLGIVPPGWQVYRGSDATLPIVIAYPPAWTVEEKKGSVSFLAPDSIAGRRPALTLLSLGVRIPGTTIEGARDQLWSTLGRSCDKTGIERTRYNDFAGLRFATLRATCDSEGRLILFSVGSGLKDGVEWDFLAASTYEIFDDSAARYFDPMLQSLNIYANLTP